MPSSSMPPPALTRSACRVFTEEQVHPLGRYPGHAPCGHDVIDRAHAAARLPPSLRAARSFRAPHRRRSGRRPLREMRLLRRKEHRARNCCTRIAVLRTGSYGSTQTALPWSSISRVIVLPSGSRIVATSSADQPRCFVSVATISADIQCVSGTGTSLCRYAIRFSRL